MWGGRGMPLTWTTPADTATHSSHVEVNTSDWCTESNRQTQGHSHVTAQPCHQDAASDWSQTGLSRSANLWPFSLAKSTAHLVAE